MTNKHFLLIGSQGSGTAMMRGLLNAHSQIECLPEWRGKRKDPRDYLHWDIWIEESRKAEHRGMIWGIKAIFQPIIGHSKGKDIARSIIQYIPRFKIIWIFRRIGQLKPVPPLPNGMGPRKTWHMRHPRSYAQQERALSEYWQIKDAYPHRVLMVSFEDVIFRPEAELKRICAFLEVEYEDGMFQGLKDTGNPCWDYGEILLEKL